MVTSSATMVLFAIRSAVKLGQQAQIAYVDSTKRRELTLPLPSFFSSPGINRAVEYFNTYGKRYVDGYEKNGELIKGSERLKYLLNELGNPSEPEKISEIEEELKTYHTEFWNLEKAEKGELTWEDNVYVDTDAINALVTVRQWRRGDDPTHSTLKRMAGTFIEIGVDYALTSPDLFDKNSSTGKALTAFLDAMDEIPFSEADLSELPFRMFTAVMETVSEYPELASGDQKVQELIRVTAGALNDDVNARIKEINKSGLDAAAKRNARFRAEDWAELVFRSTLASGGRLVLSEPGRYLGTKGEDKKALVTNVGISILDLILSQEDNYLDTVFSREGLETVLTASLKTVGEYPEILTDTKNAGLKKLLSQVASDLSKVENLLNRDILPEVTRMILERSAENIYLFWPDLKKHPEKNLLLAAAKTTLEIISRKPENNDTWKPVFNRSDLLMVTEVALDELVSNPAWLIDKTIEVNNVLAEVLEATLAVLRKRGKNYLSTEAARDILCEVLKAITLRQEFFKKFSDGQQIITAVIDAVLASIFDKDLEAEAAWQVLRSKVIKVIISISLNELAKSKLDPAVITKLKEVLKNEIDSLIEGNAFDPDNFEKILSESLEN